MIRNLILIFILGINSTSWLTSYAGAKYDWCHNDCWGNSIYFSPDTILITPASTSQYNYQLRGFTETPPPPQPARQAAEFEPMQGVLIRYPFGISLSLIAEMSEDVDVVTIVSNISEQNYVTTLYNNNGVNISNCSFLTVPGTECFYTRDYGPWFIFTGNNEYGITDFVYNRPTRPVSDGVPADYGNESGVPVYGMNLIHTGGNYMTDGMGVSASTSLLINENPTLNIAQINQLVNDYLGIHTYFLPDDIYTSGIMHIDCWAKFLSPDKIMIRKVPEWHSAYQKIESRVQFFSSQISSYGTPYKIFRVYTPEDEAYTNALILNKKVFIPLWGTEWDDDAIISWQQAMPGYEVLGITGSWTSNDALHCRTMGITDRNMLYIKHTPLHDTESANINLFLSAIIHPFSGSGLITDSLLVYWRNTTGNWNTMQLQQAAPDSFFTFIPMQELGSTVEYYIHAADSSGKSENHPFIGAADPHKFNVGLDLTPPEILHTPFPEQYPANTTLDISTWAWDINDVQSAIFEYYINDVIQSPVNLDLSSGNNYTASLTPSISTGDTIRYRIAATDNSNQHNTGYFPSSGYFEIAIVPVIPVLVLDPSNSSGQLIANCIDSLNIENDYFTSFYEVNVHKYYTIFLCLGVYSDNYILSNEETNLLADYINSGGKVYMEGSDCWVYDDSHLLLDPLFHVNPVNDGDSIFTPITGKPGTLSEYLEYNYSGDNYYMDIISEMPDADLIFTTGSDDGRGVAYNHNTVGMSFELAGLKDTVFPSTRKELVRRILEYFGVWPGGIGHIPSVSLSMKLIPNPSAGNVCIQYSLSVRGNTCIKIFDLNGKTIRTWNNGIQNTGNYSVIWDRTGNTRDIASAGIYFVQINLNGKPAENKKIILVK